MTKEKNNAVSLIATVAVIISLFLLSATIAFAASDNATTNESFTQGLQKDGNPVNPLRSVAADALGATDGEFVSLGYGGELIVGFAQNMSGNLSLAVQEFTGGAYPLETADVYVGTDPTGPWTYVGEATNDEGAGDETSTFAVAECYQYVRVVDTTDEAIHNATSDGFDVDSFTANYDESCPEPEPEPMPAGHTRISLHSAAVVMNEVTTAANTGGNTAGGSYAGNGGSGGDIDNTGGDQDVEGTATGNGGVGGNSGLGGAVQTGDALAVASLTNTVNSNVVRVGADCGCDGDLGRVRIRTHDFAMLGNRLATAANSGDNTAEGSEAGTGGNGGDIDNGAGGHGHGDVHKDGNNGGGDDDASQEIDDSTTGSGAAGGSSDAGGSVLTGAATSRATVVNLVNSNRIRVR